MIAGIIIGAIILIVLIIGITQFNAFVALKNKVDEAFSTMDVYMKKRYDLIPNLVETVKGYAAHEKETITGVIEARNRAYSSESPKETIENNNVLTEALGRLFAVAEQYPNLKADTQFSSLQRELSSIENEIAQSRKYYNGVVKQLNTKVEMFPSNIVAGMFHFEKAPFYEIENQEERQNVKVKF